jgi:flagellar hook-length control protein FliK
LQTAATGVAVSQPAVATASAALPTDDAAKPADDPNDDVAPLSAQTIVAQAGQSVQPTSSGQANSVGQPAAEAFSSSIAAANRSMTLASAATNVSDDNLRPLADKTKPADGADSGKVAVSDPTTSQSNVPMHLSVNKASQADSPSAATTTDDVGQAGRVRFVQRVEQAFQSMSDQGGTVRLKLSPPELGSMRLEITVRNGVMTARAETETPAGRNMLLDNLPMLRERLAQQDIKVQRFDIDLMDHSGGGASGQASYFADSQAHSGNGRSGQASAAAGVDSQTVGAAGAATGLGEGNQLNVIV